MKKFYKKDQYRINFVISVLIVCGFTASILVNYFSYSDIIKDDIRNITKLSSSNIYSEINNELIKPIFVSLTMANDSFLKEWLLEEERGEIETLQTYLGGIREKYGYSSVFLVSDQTQKYYHYQGVKKELTEEDDHDQWYWEFIESEKTYDLDVDVDEVTNKVTVFVNCLVLDSNNHVLGVVGVGLEMSQVQQILGTFEDAYNLEAFLVDPEGLVQVHTSNQLIEEYNVNEDQIIQRFMDDIIANQTTLETYRYNENGLDGYLITRYIDELEWYLMVKKDTSILRNSFNTQLAEELIIVVIVLIGLILIINSLIRNHQKRLSEVAVTDILTGLLNRRGLNHALYDQLKEASGKNITFSVFILDIDNFKQINDVHGHMFGDRVIEEIARYIDRIIGEQGVIGRWGGDEFAGFIREDEQAAEEILKSALHGIAEKEHFSENMISISIGMTLSRPIDTPDTIIARADKALYVSKQNGKNQLNKQ